MSTQRPRCDCELDLAAARAGDLPGVCVCCGEATNQFQPTPLRYRGKRIRLRLPYCGTHKKHEGRDSLPLNVLLVGVSLFVLGLCLLMVLVSADSLPGVVRVALGVAAVGAILLGLVTVAISLGGYALLTVRDIAMGRFLGLSGPRIRIRRLGNGAVTLMHVAPEFVEACRVYREGRLDSSASSARPEAEGPPALFR
jgi:hypothetical protein